MKNILRFLVSPKSDYTFYKSEEFLIDENKTYGAYIHIPFCKNLCPYCPYYKLPYDKREINKFKRAIKKEIDLTIKKYPKIKFASLYMGGGTPTVLGDELVKIISYFKIKFNLKEHIAIELHPSGVDESLLRRLKDIGVTHISLGIQTFNNNLIKEIGRSNYFNHSLNAINTAKKIGFKLINIDMMFALPHQTLEELNNDLVILKKIKPDQITFYPLFTFPYSKVGELKKIKNVKMPNFFVRRKMYYYIHEEMVKLGYKRIDVWSFKKIEEGKFSSVTRNYYIGFGPSAGTYDGKSFYFNTFSFSDYVSYCKKRKPTILKLDVDKKMEKIFWFYWRLYETEIPKKEYKKLFGSDIEQDFRVLFFLFRFFKFIEKETKNSLKLNINGVFYIHLLQNFFALDYINKIWDTCKRNKNPNKIKL